MLIQQLALDAAFATVRSARPACRRRTPRPAARVRGQPHRALARTSLTVRVVRQFTHFFAALLWVAALLALIADWWMPGQGMVTLAAAIVAVIAINGAFSFWQEYRAEETMAALQRLLPHQVRVLRNGTTVVLPAEDVVPGDVIFLTAGDDVPADCRLIEASACASTTPRSPAKRGRYRGTRDRLSTRTCCRAATCCWPAPP